MRAKNNNEIQVTAGTIRVAVYVRVSTNEQAEEGHSIGVQTEKLQAYCVARGWEVFKVYTDPGFSRSNMDRPALKSLFSDIKSGLINTVLVYKLDRLSRSQRDTLYMIEDVFLAQGVDFISMTENFDTSTPLGRAMIGILSVFAQLEREQIKERMAMGNVARAASGLWRGGSGAPIGYDYIDGGLVVNEYEAMQIRLIFDLFLKGYTFHAIKVALQNRGYTNKYGSWKNAAIISKVLRNTTYIGKVRYAGKEYEGQHDPLVSMDIWDATQLRLAEVTRGLSDHQKSPFVATKLLTGCVWCGDCGARYFYHGCNKKNAKGEMIHYDYYTCYTRAAHKTMRRAKHCNGRTWKQPKLDAIIIGEIKKLALSKDVIESVISEHRSGSSVDARADAIGKRLKELDNQLNKVMDLYTLGSIPLASVQAKADAINQEKAALSSELESLHKEQPQLSASKAFDLASMADVIFANGTMEEQRNLVQSLIDKIELNADGSITIYWKFA